MAFDAETKRKWVEALKSGGYRQGQGCLRSRDDAYCCLGVLCDISGGGEWQSREEEDGSKLSYRFVTPLGSSVADIPWPLNWRVDLTYADRLRLMKLNDNGSTFVEIAAHIEENL